MFRKPGAGRSKTSADTLCQKCLKRGHYSYECKATTQERPYVSRPSRTQQLLNPKLKPKLTTEVPNELLRKKGVADEILKKKEEDRDRDRTSRKRSRSSSADSISTISTNRSPSRSPSPRRRKHDAPPKRSRRPVSMDSRSSLGSRDKERNTRRRMSSFSPGERGRRRTRSRSRSKSSYMHNQARGGSRGADESRSRSRSRKRHGKRPARVTRSRSRTPDHMDTSDDHNSAARGRWGASPPAKQPQEPLRSRKSPSPHSRRRAPSPHGGEKRHEARENSGKMDDNHSAGFDARNRFNDGPVHRNSSRNGPPPAQPPSTQRERSLSPFSKRVALTKAMNAGQM